MKCAILVTLFCTPNACRSEDVSSVLFSKLLPNYQILQRCDLQYRSLNPHIRENLIIYIYIYIYI